MASSSASLASTTPKSKMPRLTAKNGELSSRTGEKNVSVGLIKKSNPRPGRMSIHLVLFSPLIVTFIMTTAISDSDHIAVNIAYHDDAPVPFSDLYQSCGSISSGVVRSYQRSFLTQPTAGVRSSFLSRKRRWKRSLVNSPSIVLRGGATPLSSQPLIDTKSVSLALRLTCETNRRLHHGITERPFFKSRSKSAADTICMDTLTMVPDKEVIASVQPQQQTMTSASTPHTLREVTDEELMEERLHDEWTVFHSFERFESDDNEDHRNRTEQTHRREMLRYGPELQSFLKTLLCAFGLDEKGTSGSSYILHNSANTKQQQPVEDELQIILSLTLMYLDRSSNTPLHVDPLTGQSWCPPCPHVLPQTVHRLLLTAMLFAIKNVRGDKSVSNKLRNAANSLLNEKQVISQNDMEAMENWMLNALRGGTGMHLHQHDLMWQITPEEISTFLRNWGRLFYPQRLAAQDQTRMEHLERLWRDQRGQFGISHGHGNYWSEQVPLTEYPLNPELHSQNQLTQRQYYEPM